MLRKFFAPNIQRKHSIQVCAFLSFNGHQYISINDSVRYKAKNPLHTTHVVCRGFLYN